MTKIVIVTTPSFDGHGKRRHGRFDVRLQGGDEVICEATQQPLLDASRALLQRGADRTATICKVRADAPTIVTMRAPIGVAAQYDVMGSAFVRRKPAAGPMPGSRIENTPSAGPVVPGNTNATLGASHNGSLKTASPPSPTSLAAPSPTAPAARPHPKGK
jgi:hypothetical protein